MAASAVSLAYGHWGTAAARAQQRKEDRETVSGKETEWHHTLM